MSGKTHLPESDLIQLCQRRTALEVTARARFSLLDWLGCVIAARRSNVARAMGRACDVQDEDLLRASVASHGTDAQTAALMLGTLGNVFEMDDLHRASILHPGDAVAAATLAAGLRQHCTGRALLAALTRGYEGAIRIGRVAASGGYTGFYNSGTCGVFGAAIAATDLKTGDPDILADAMGQAGMMAAGIWQCRLEPTYSKQLATAHAARAGVLAAELAMAGFPGARAILTGPMGFFRNYYPACDTTLLTAPGDWALLEMSFKPFAACRHAHPAISAALALRGGDVGTAPEKIPEQITVQTYRAAIEFCDAPDPATADEARFSLQHAVAVALAKGVPTIADFELGALGAPEITALRARVRLEVDADLDAAFPQGYGARVRIVTAEGDVRSETCPAAWGDPENPMSEADIIAKFRANAAHGDLAPHHADRLVQAVMDLPDAPDLGVLRFALSSAFTTVPETCRCL